MSGYEDHKRKEKINIIGNGDHNMHVMPKIESISLIKIQSNFY